MGWASAKSRAASTFFSTAATPSPASVVARVREPTWARSSPWDAPHLLRAARAASTLGAWEAIREPACCASWARSATVVPRDRNDWPASLSGP